MYFFLSFFSFPFLSPSSSASYHSLPFTIISLTLFLLPTHFYCLYRNYSFFVFNRFAHPFITFLFFLFYFLQFFPWRLPAPSRLRASFNLFACHWRLVAIIHNFLTFPRLHFPPKIVAKEGGVNRNGWDRKVLVGKQGQARERRANSVWPKQTA